MGFDPPWPPDAVVGRVVEAQRDGRCFYRRATGQLRRERLLTTGHHVLGDVWGVLRRVKALFVALCMIMLTVTLVWAAVDITSFVAEVGINSVTLKWETASETNNLGYRLWRSLDNDDYVDISGFISSEDEGAGASYVYTDTAVTPGITYYYKLIDVPDDGTDGKYTDPISATISLATTPTLTPAPTATPTITPTPLPTSTPNPNVRFWADKTDLTAGECTTLYWQTNNIRAVFFDNQAVGGDGQGQFCPCATETHTLLVRYLNGEDEPFVITLNVTGQCGVATATATSTSVPQGTVSNEPTATPRPTFIPGPTRPPVGSTATPSAEVYVPTATAPAAMPVATQTVAQDEAQPAEPLASPLATLPASSESQVGSTATSSLPPTRPAVAGEPSGVPVDELLSVWLLIIGGIVGAGFIGAGILMWKRQQ